MIKSILKLFHGLLVSNDCPCKYHPCDCGNKLSCRDPELNFGALTDIKSLDEYKVLKRDPALVRNCYRLTEHRRNLYEKLKDVRLHK